MRDINTMRGTNRLPAFPKPAYVLVALMGVIGLGGAGAGHVAGAAPVALFPASGAKDVPPDALLRIAFAAPPAIGSGKIRIDDVAGNSVVDTIDVGTEPATRSIGGLPNFKYFPVIIAGNEAMIYPRNGALAYGKTYAVTVDRGAFKGAPVPGTWRFSTKAGPPPAGTAKLTVAADGSGDFCTVQGALDFVPEQNPSRTTIFVRRGTYAELVYVARKPRLTLVGEDRKQTIIQYPNNAKFNPANDQHTYHRGVFMANGCDDLVISNLTIRNTTRRGGSQAEALILQGNTRSRAVLCDMNLYSFQDTLQINGQACVENCYIEGDVDFMWGSGPCFFENCHCFGTRSKAYYTQIRNPATHHGYVYHHCTFDGPPGVVNMYLSRIDPARFPNSEVVLLDCVLGAAVNPVGWLLNKSDAAPDIHFWEYNSRDPSGKPVDTSKRLPASKQLKLPEDAKRIEDYSKPGFVLGENWDPRTPVGRGK
jgi:pectin methylesterase-like acyl-CoA thioesterase